MKNKSDVNETTNQQAYDMSHKDPLLVPQGLQGYSPELELKTMDVEHTGYSLFNIWTAQGGGGSFQP